MVLNLSPDSQALFTQYGWSATRRVSDDEMQEWLVVRLEGEPMPLKIHPPAYELLLNVGGLAIGEEGEDNPYLPLVWQPNSRAVHHVGWSDHEWQLRESLFPVGYFGQRGYEEVIALGLSGKVYGLDDIAPGVLILGDSIEEAIERIVEGDIFTRVSIQTDQTAIEIVRKIRARLGEQ